MLAWTGGAHGGRAIGHRLGCWPCPWTSNGICPVPAAAEQVHAHVGCDSGHPGVAPIASVALRQMAYDGGMVT
jgi:hypothetical protein